MYWQVEYDMDWLPICEICKQWFRKLCSHVYQSHSIKARQYKVMYWLDVKKWICCDDTRHSLQEHVKKNYDLVVTENLLHKWKQTRFNKWQWKWKKKSYISEQTKRMLKEKIYHIHKNNMRDIYY